MTFCIMDAQCTVYDRRQDLPGMTYTEALCQGCRDALRGDLNGLRYDYVDLTQLLPPADNRNDAGKIFSPKPESMAPVNLAAMHLRGDIAWLVGVVALVIRRQKQPQLRWGPVLPVREGFQLDQDVRYLSERTNDIASMKPLSAYWDAESDTAQELDGAALVLRLKGLHSRARRMCGTEPRTMTLPGFCATCNTVSLRRHDDNSDAIWCVHCKTRWTAADYGRMVRLQAPTSGS
jgi:hypothetical protein